MTASTAPSGRVLQRVASGRWWALLVAALATFVTLRNGGTATDLVVVYWLEGFAWVGAAYVKDLHARGPVTCEVVHAVRSDPRAVLGQSLPEDLRRVAAGRNLNVSIIVTTFAGTFATSLRYELAGGLTRDPMLWLLVLVSILTWTALDLWGWWHSDLPTTTSPDGGGSGPITRMLLVFAVALVGGVTAVETSPETGTFVSVLAYIVARGWIEPTVQAGVDRRRARNQCCPPHAVPQAASDAVTPASPESWTGPALWFVLGAVGLFAGYILVSPLLHNAEVDTLGEDVTARVLESAEKHEGDWDSGQLVAATGEYGHLVTDLENLSYSGGTIVLTLRTSNPWLGIGGLEHGAQCLAVRVHGNRVLSVEQYGVDRGSRNGAC